MRSRLGILLAAGLAATAGSVVPAAAADQASTPSAASSASFSLTNLTITKTTLSDGSSRQVTLRCESTGGTHPTAEDACTKLIAVDGRFDKLPYVPNTGCPPVWRPVTVTVTGTWRLQPVSFTKTYGGDCDASILSNYVFRF
ncbi:SSI family serine proteinase inhibitor [Streptomyces sp. UH6]|uniref:SSI family serine proteinase inhibitor n=1 Tax=Streptomyces sp. UH6 TaxID=2748379 RepID=UPI0015D511D3|nr:SSI family serine proteinase inhibitor [Streptomyces sp. UH6]NYV72864.1 protease inhibitorprecursor [Streptomyces sp. UH6]